jgi:hypothetical protein
MHIMEPPDLWERYIDRKYKDRAPHGVTSSNVRDLRMVYPDGREWCSTSGLESAGTLRESQVPGRIAAPR